MTSQLDIYRTANVLIQQYGDQTLSIATKRAQALADQDDIEGAGDAEITRAAEGAP